MASSGAFAFITGDLWSWFVLLVIVGGLLASYFASIRQQRIADVQVSKKNMLVRRLFFTAGIVLVSLAWLVPMNVLGDSFDFTVHMSQHLLLSLLAPPLLLYGLFRFVDGEGLHLPALLVPQMGKRGLLFPLLASLLFNANIWLWHAPPLFLAMMQQSGLHLLSDLLYLVTGLLFWWPLLVAFQDGKNALPLGGTLAYIFFSDMPMMLLGAGLTFFPSFYMMPMANGATMPISATDQQLGGLFMWVLSNLFFVAIASGFFLRWLLRRERIEQEADSVRALEEEEDESVVYEQHS